MSTAPATSQHPASEQEAIASLFKGQITASGKPLAPDEIISRTLDPINRALEAAADVPVGLRRQWCDFVNTQIDLVAFGIEHFMKPSSEKRHEGAFDQALKHLDWTKKVSDSISVAETVPKCADLLASAQHSLTKVREISERALVLDAQNYLASLPDPSLIAEGYQMDELDWIEAQIAAGNELPDEVCGFAPHEWCDVHYLLESDYNLGGWLQERESNIRRGVENGYAAEGTHVQLSRMGYQASPNLCLDTLEDETRRLYRMLEERYGFEPSLDHSETTAPPRP